MRCACRRISRACRLEAMSYGNAVICSDIPENTAVCGDAALTFKKGDVADLKGKLNLLLENKEKTEHLRGIAAGHVLSRFSWDKTADATCELYDNILKGEYRRHTVGISGAFKLIFVC